MPKRKAVAIVTDFFYPEVGGVQTHVADLAKYAVKHGYKVYVVTTYGDFPRLEYENGISIIRVPYPRYAGFLGLTGLGRRYKQIFRELDPDIIHAHHMFSPSGVIAGKIAGELGIPSVITNHSIPVGYEAYKRFWDVISKGLTLLPVAQYIRYYNAAIAVSKLAADYLRIFYPGFIRIIPPPIDYEYFNIRATKNEVGFREDDKIVLFVGRLSPKKGLEFVIYAFRLVYRLEKRAKLVIVGPTNTPYYDYLRALIRLLGLEGNVVFTGRVDRDFLRKIYASADVFVFPSYGGESFGIVALESMAAGTPVVTTIGGALAKYIERYRLGVLTGFNIKKFAMGVIKLLRCPELRRELGENAKRFARLFSWDNIFSKIKEVYSVVSHK